ncbi:hypothetical protein K458DRAFT_88128 [Lentithecium fluviatile CBS 122367]|uniref:Uncharacterized protein n=1 Tax=Lentithecium fluviatile CBS 122367 TaxID=1168545 RepID=A0A6G1IS97_9PLEO|nr:hypothetical protein K458DRAFT_88128 [Lentithecium fluviatile CBS 122367]
MKDFWNPHPGPSKLLGRRSQRNQQRYQAATVQTPLSIEPPARKRSLNRSASERSSTIVQSRTIYDRRVASRPYSTLSAAGTTKAHRQAHPPKESWIFLESSEDPSTSTKFSFRTFNSLSQHCCDTNASASHSHRRGHESATKTHILR